MLDLRDFQQHFDAAAATSCVVAVDEIACDCRLSSLEIASR